MFLVYILLYPVWQRGGQEDEDVWARAELPMSNDVQVEQATRAVWQVGES